LQLAIGQALIAIKGYAASEVERAFDRARDLCGLLGDPAEVASALFRLWAVNYLRDELRIAYELAEQLMRRAQSASGDATLLILAHIALGDTLGSMGEPLTAMDHFESAIALYDPERHRQLTIFGGDARVNPLSYAGLTLWGLGYPDQALKKNEGIAGASSVAITSAYRSLCRVLLGSSSSIAARRTRGSGECGASDSRLY
jgi:predicted ATPase